jgi:hypothetical protein
MTAGKVTPVDQIVQNGVSELVRIGRSADDGDGSRGEERRE